MAKFLIVPRRCPECTTIAYLPFSMYQELTRFLPYSSKDGLSGYYLCDACNLISDRTPTTAPPSMYDTDNPRSGALCENLFAIGLACVDKTCESHALVLAPKIEGYKSDADLIRDSSRWRVVPDVRCDEGHPAQGTPVKIVGVLRIVPRT